MKTYYCDDLSQLRDNHKYYVTFFVDGKRLVREFEDERDAWVFKNKIEHSKRAILESCPLFK